MGKKRESAFESDALHVEHEPLYDLAKLAGMAYERVDFSDNLLRRLPPFERNLHCCYGTAL